MRTDAWKDSVKRLEDRFGQYVLAVVCPKCAHERMVNPETLANVVGWKTEIAAAMERMRCSHCGARGATWRVEAIPRPRGRGDR